MGNDSVIGNDQSRYRLKLARGFLTEAQQDLELKRWRSVMDNAQVTIENAAKALLALLEPIGRTHKPAPLLRQALQEGTLAVDDPK